MSASKLDIFIAGETVDLCEPSSDPEVLEQWYRWFNRPKVTAYLAQGALPNTREDQERFISATQAARDRLVVLIREKATQQLVGVASLSSINHSQRQCDMAVVIGEQAESADALFYALEVKARLTSHAFDVLGVERINSTQVIDLIRWQRWQIIFGYQIEGVLRGKFRKGRRVYDVLASSCLIEDYLKLLEQRDGQFWPGKARVFEMIKQLPPRALLDDLIEWLGTRQNQYWNAVNRDGEKGGGA